MREPAKLRPWLCSITRFLVSKYFRREAREPAYAAETLEAVLDWAAPEPLPPDQIINEEENAILWRSLDRIPEIYREPLVLFYRQQQSIETVAHDLGLSEDAVKQRLSRGTEDFGGASPRLCRRRVETNHSGQDIHHRRDGGPATAGNFR